MEVTTQSDTHYPDLCPNFPKSKSYAGRSHTAWCGRESMQLISVALICAGRFPVILLGV